MRPSGPPARLRRAWLAGFAAAALSATAAEAQSAPARALSLEEALQLALPESEAVALSRVAIDRAEADRIRVRSARLPQLNGSVAYARQLRSQFAGLLDDTDPDPDEEPRPTSCDAFRPDPTRPLEERLAALELAVECTTTANPFADFGRLPFGRANTYSLGLSGSQLLFDGGRVGGQLRAARAGQEVARIGLTSTEAQVTLDVVQAYYDAILSDRLVAIAEATLAQTDTTLRQTELRRTVGTAPEFDVLRARVARENQRPLVIAARTRRDVAHVRLKQLLNLTPETELALTTELADTTLASAPTLAQLIRRPPDTAAIHRAAVRQAALAVDAQTGLARSAGADRLPSVSLSSQWTRLAYPSRGFPAWNEFVTDWQVSLGVQIPIFAGGRIRGARQAAAAGVTEARVRHQQATEAAQLDARNVLAALEAAHASWDASEGTAAEARRAYEIAELRFQEGISTQTELLDARIALQQAEVNRAEAARDLTVARVRLALLPDLPLAGVSAQTIVTETPIIPTARVSTISTLPGGQRFP